FDRQSIQHPVRAVGFGPTDTSGIFLMKTADFSNYVQVSIDEPWIGELSFPISFMAAYAWADNTVVSANGSPVLDIILYECPPSVFPKRSPVVYRNAAGDTA